ncbi:hypothetical protein KIPB_014965, partial [Kipferlia bialata]|eukprot:g14965.t1
MVSPILHCIYSCPPLLHLLQIQADRMIGEQDAPTAPAPNEIRTFTATVAFLRLLSKGRSGSTEPVDSTFALLAVGL